MKKDLILGFQHTLAMFSACVLIPILMGFDIPVALFMAGVGTLIFNVLTGGKIPVFLASSGSFVAVIILINQTFGVQYAYGAIAVSGLVYLVAALIVKLIGHHKFIQAFPPIVVAPIIMLIGITLTPISIGMASEHWILALITMATVVIVGIFAKGFFKLLPILSGIIVGYVSAVFMGLVDFTPVLEAAWFALPQFSAPQFAWGPILLLAPIALVTVMEHIGEIGANSNVVGKNWFDKPGLHRTLFANGITISLAGLIGAPPNTTYGENTATLALTKQYRARIIRIAAVFAVVLAFIGKFSVLINTIPTAVMGGISFILFGTLICIGLQQLIVSQVDLHDMRNSIVVLATLIVGISSITAANVIEFKVVENLSLMGLSLAAFVAVFLNLIINVIFKERK